jgi:hypothetical protein
MSLITVFPLSSPRVRDYRIVATRQHDAGQVSPSFMFSSMSSCADRCRRRCRATG